MRTLLVSLVIAVAATVAMGVDGAWAQAKVIVKRCWHFTPAHNSR
jgi:hypothetical protein